MNKPSEVASNTAQASFEEIQPPSHAVPAAPTTRLVPPMAVPFPNQLPQKAPISDQQPPLLIQKAQAAQNSIPAPKPTIPIERDNKQDQEVLRKQKEEAERRKKEAVIRARISQLREIQDTVKKIKGAVSRKEKA